MFKNISEEGYAIAKFVRSIATLGKGPFWKRAIVYIIWWGVVIGIVIGTPAYLLSTYEKQRQQYLNDTGYIGERNQQMIIKDALNLCLESIKTNHHYKERYCDYSILMFEQDLRQHDEFLNELVEAKAYEQMIISTDASIRSIENIALAKRNDITSPWRILDLFFTPLGLFAYLTVTFLLLTLPLIVFYVGSKSSNRVRHLNRR